ncbi:MAG: XdhC family protein [Gammaproteobacteria bacterium]|nr:XdhC family protein [Gammaproteobacteria bacterium]
MSTSTNLESCFKGLASEDTPLALATVIQTALSTSGNVGDKALVSAEGIVEGWIGGGCAQPAVVAAVRLALESAKPLLIRVGPKGEWEALDGVVDFSSGCLSGGTQVIFIEPLNRQAKLSILGDSPVALSLSDLAGRLDFSVTVISPDLESSQLPETIHLEHDFVSVSGDFVVVATQGRHDRAALKAAIKSNAGYIGVVASRKKIAGLKASLIKSGIAASEMERVQSPAGIEIGAVSSAEIALSILAELVQLRQSGSIQKISQASDTAKEPAESATDIQGGGCCSGHG